jgi:hypothetical protein
VDDAEVLTLERPHHRTAHDLERITTPQATDLVEDA